MKLITYIKDQKMGNYLTETVVPLIKPYIPNDSVIKVCVDHNSEIHVLCGTEVDHHIYDHSIHEAPAYRIQLSFRKYDRRLTNATLIIHKKLSVLNSVRMSPLIQRNDGKTLESIRVQLAPKYPYVLDAEMTELSIEELIHRIMTNALESVE